LLDTPLDPFAATGELIRHGRTVAIDLRLPIEQIWQEFRRNHRNNITQLREAGDIVAEPDPDWVHFDEFLQAYRATMDRVGAEQSYYFQESYYQGLRAALGNRAHLFVVKIRDRIAAAAILTEVCGIVQYHLAKERGNRLLHMGGGLGGQEDDLYNYKAGFSKLRHPFYTWRACCDVDLYKHVNSLWEEKLRPDSLDPSFFPPYRQLHPHSRA
jgi:hypothetical protein